MTSVYDERGPERVSVAGRRWAEWEERWARPRPQVAASVAWKSPNCLLQRLGGGTAGGKGEQLSGGTFGERTLVPQLGHSTPPWREGSSGSQSCPSVLTILKWVPGPGRDTGDSSACRNKRGAAVSVCHSTVWALSLVPVWGQGMESLVFIAGTFLSAWFFSFNWNCYTGSILCTHSLEENLKAVWRSTKQGWICKLTRISSITIQMYFMKLLGLFQIFSVTLFRKYLRDWDAESKKVRAATSIDKAVFSWKVKSELRSMKYLFINGNQNIELILC